MPDVIPPVPTAFSCAYHELMGWMERERTLNDAPLDMHERERMRRRMAELDALFAAQMSREDMQ